MADVETLAAQVADLRAELAALTGQMNSDNGLVAEGRYGKGLATFKVTILAKGGVAFYDGSGIRRVIFSGATTVAVGESADMKKLALEGKISYVAI